MQCSRLMAYVIGATGLSMLSSRLLEMRGSFIRNVPPGSKIDWMELSTSNGWAWSCTELNTNAAPNGWEQLSVAASATSNERKRSATRTTPRWGTAGRHLALPVKSISIHHGGN
jgi:hypothetical protein